MIGMSLILKRGIKKGISFCKFFNNDGVECTALWQISDMITGTRAQESLGIFTSGGRGAVCQVSKVKLLYGHVEKIFEFPIIDFEHDNIKLIHAGLQLRMNMIKDWVSSIDWDEELEIDLGV